MTIPSAEAKAYKETVGWIAKVAGYKEPTKTLVVLSLTLMPPEVDKNGKRTGASMDLSNCLKVAEDALQGIVYVNDRQVKEIHLRYGPRFKRGALIVDIDEFIPAPAPLFAEASA